MLSMRRSDLNKGSSFVYVVFSYGILYFPMQSAASTRSTCFANSTLVLATVAVDKIACFRDSVWSAM